MLKRILCGCAVACLFSVFATSVSAAADDYKSFDIGTGTVASPLSWAGGGFSTDSLFNQYGKNYALSLAQAYCTYINLTGIEKALPAAGADEQLTSDIITTFGPNFYLATGSQESGLNPNQGGSGYLQIDDSTQNMAQNSQVTGNANFMSYCRFLSNVDHYSVVSGTNVCTSNIVKAYFDSITYFLHAPAITSFGVNYAKNSEFSKPVNVEGKDYVFPAVEGMMRVTALYYNRGQWFGTATNIVNANGSVSIESQIKYSEGYGGRYVYQLPDLYNRFKDLSDNGNAYEAQISQDEMISYLESLKTLYSSAVINAGVNKVQEMMQEKNFNFRSHDFYNVMNEVTKVMLEASRM